MFFLFLLVPAVVFGGIHEDLLRLKEDVGRVLGSSFEPELDTPHSFLAARADSEARGPSATLPVSGPDYQTIVVQPPAGPAITLVIPRARNLAIFGTNLLRSRPGYTPFPTDNPALVEKHVRMFKKWVASWTAGAPGKYLKRVFLCQTLSLFGGSPFAGFFYAEPGDTLWMAQSTIDQDEWLSTLYHEHAHLVQQNVFPGTSDPWTQKWLALLPAGWRWRGQCGAACSRDFKPSLFPQGFITGYNTVSLAEDVAQFANCMWMGTLNCYKAADANPVIKKKMDLIVEFYSKVDPAFTRAIFNERKAAGKTRLFASTEGVRRSVNLPASAKWSPFTGGRTMANTA